SGNSKLPEERDTGRQTHSQVHPQPSLERLFWSPDDERLLACHDPFDVPTNLVRLIGQGRGGLEIDVVGGLVDAVPSKCLRCDLFTLTREQIPPRLPGVCLRRL